MMFCTDADLLYWEPRLFHDAATVAETLMNGAGDLNDTHFAVTGGDLIPATVQANQVISFTGIIDASYTILNVDSTTQLTLSVRWEGLTPESGTPTAGAIDYSPDLPFSIRSFWAQRRVVSDLLRQMAGLSVPSTDVTPVLMNPQVLKRPCILGTLQMVYNALAAAAEPGSTAIRAELYQRLYRQSLRNCVVELDCNGDGRVDAIRRLDVLELTRT